MTETKRYHPIVQIHHNGGTEVIAKCNELLEPMGYLIINERARSFDVAETVGTNSTPKLIAALLATIFVVNLQYDGLTRKWIGYSII